MMIYIIDLIFIIINLTIIKIIIIIDLIIIILFNLAILKIIDLTIMIIITIIRDELEGGKWLANSILQPAV